MSEPTPALRTAYFMTFTKNRVFYWPLFGYMCYDLEEAKEEFDRCVADEPDQVYQLVSFQVAEGGRLMRGTDKELYSHSPRVIS